MRLVILEEYDEASEWAAKYIRNRIIQFRPTADRYFALGLPTGSTPFGCSKKLIEYHKSGDLSFKLVKTFNMDEYVDLPRSHPESYHSYMWNNFFKHIDINPGNSHILDGNASDLQGECEAFEQKIAVAGGIDLVVGGRVEQNLRCLECTPNPTLIKGIPNIMYSIPELWGTEDCAMPLDKEKLERSKGQCVFRHHVPCDEDLFDFCMILVDERGLQFPSRSPLEAIDLYLALRNASLHTFD